jgi:hypothetical protein
VLQDIAKSALTIGARGFSTVNVLNLREVRFVLILV